MSSCSSVHGEITSEDLFFLKICRMIFNDNYVWKNSFLLLSFTSCQGLSL